MSRVILLPLFLFVCLYGTAQTTLDNLDLEDWTASESGRFDEPDGPWATANFAVDLEIIAPATNPVEKTSDAFSGQYAAKMESLTIFFTFTSGALWTGDFVLDIGDPTNSPKFGVPYTGTPERFQCHYKYFPVSGDSMDIYSTLFKWNSTTQQRDTVAHCQLRSTQTVSDYTALDLEFDYKMQGVTPDTMQIAFTSSAAGNDFAGQIGSQLYVDNVKLVDPVGIINVLSPEIAVKTYPNPANDQIMLELDDVLLEGQLLVFDAMGRLVQSSQTIGELINLDLTDWKAGTYYFLLKNKGGHDLSSGSFIVN